MSESIYCAHVRPDGTPCPAYADRDNGYCWHHRPADTLTADRQRDRTTEPILDAPGPTGLPRAPGP